MEQLAIRDRTIATLRTEMDALRNQTAQWQRDAERWKTERAQLQIAFEALAQQFGDAKQQMANMAREMDSLRHENFSLRNGSSIGQGEIRSVEALALGQLRSLLTKRLSAAEVSTVAFDLGVADDLAGETHPERVASLLDACERRCLGKRLMDELRRMRPDLELGE